MNQSDFAPIRERLVTMQQNAEHPPELPEEQLWARPRSPELPNTQPPQGAVNQAAAMQALRQRSQQVGAVPSPEAPAPPMAALPPEVSLHLKRLQQEAARINDLGKTQAMAIQDFKRSADRLAWSLRRQPMGYGYEFEQFCELRDAIVSQVEEDEYGKLTLTTATVDLYLDEQQANQNAQQIRAFSQTRTATRSRRSTSNWLADPLGTAETVWHSLTRQLERRSRLTALDCVIWLGGGLIGRLALELLLAASPGLWPWIVGATVGAVALALYRLLLSPRPDVAFVTRIFLALLGLVIGGQF